MQSRTSRALIVALVAALVVVVRGAQRQRRMLVGDDAPTALDTYRANRAVRRAVHGLVLVLFANPIGDAIDKVRGFFGGIADDLYNFVRTIIDYVGGILLSLIQQVADAITQAVSVLGNVIGAVKRDLVNLIAAGINGVLGVINDVRGALNSAIAGLAGFLTSAVDELRNLIGSALSAALDFARAVLTEATTFARGLFDDAVAFARGLVDDLAHGVNVLFTFLGNRLDDAISWVQDTVGGIVSSLLDDLAHGLGVLRDWVTGLVGDVFTALHDVFFAALDALRNDILGPLETLFAWVVDHARPVVDVVEAVIDWLIWLAKLPFSAATDLAHGWRDLTLKRVVEDLPGRTVALGPGVLEHIVKDLTG
jgi:phage-related protein